MENTEYVKMYDLLSLNSFTISLIFSISAFVYSLNENVNIYLYGIFLVATLFFVFWGVYFNNKNDRQY